MDDRIDELLNGRAVSVSVEKQEGQNVDPVTQWAADRNHLIECFFGMSNRDLTGRAIGEAPSRLRTYKTAYVQSL